MGVWTLSLGRGPAPWAGSLAEPGMAFPRDMLHSTLAFALVPLAFALPLVLVPSSPAVWPATLFFGRACVLFLVHAGVVVVDVLDGVRPIHKLISVAVAGFPSSVLSFFAWDLAPWFAAFASAPCPAILLGPASAAAPAPAPCPAIRLGPAPAPAPAPAPSPVPALAFAAPSSPRGTRSVDVTLGLLGVANIVIGEAPRGLLVAGAAGRENKLTLGTLPTFLRLLRALTSFPSLVSLLRFTPFVSSHILRFCCEPRRERGSIQFSRAHHS